MSGILALDQSTKVIGWAFAEPGSELTWGHKDVDPDGAPDGLVAQRIEVFVLARLDHFHPTYLGIEKPYIGPSASTSMRLAGVYWQLKSLAYGRCVRCVVYETRHAVKQLTGKGKFISTDAKKRATVLACRARGWPVDNADQADAIAGLLCLEAELYPAAALQRKRVLRPVEGPLFAEVAQ